MRIEQIFDIFSLYLCVCVYAYIYNMHIYTYTHRHICMYVCIYFCNQVIVRKYSCYTQQSCRSKIFDKRYTCNKMYTLSSIFHKKM